MSNILFSFGTPNFYLSLEKLKESAIGLVDEIILYNESDIDRDFYIENKKIFRDRRGVCERSPHGTGFGYMVWKSYFVDKVLKLADKNDVYIFLDAGLLLTGNVRPFFDTCRKSKQGVVVTSEGCRNTQWVKSDCFNLMGLNTPEYVHGRHLSSSVIIFRKTDFSVGFFKEWLEACTNFNIISDAPSITPDITDDFIAHRHDQSVLSLLSIKHEVECVSHQSLPLDHHRRRFHEPNRTSEFMESPFMQKMLNPKKTLLL